MEKPARRRSRPATRQVEAGAPSRRSRRAASGDIAPARTEHSIERFTVGEAVKAAEMSKLEAVRDILEKPLEPGEADRLSRLKAIVAGAIPGRPADAS